MNIYIVLSSVTFAMQSKDALELNDITCRVRQAPRQIAHRGCAYSVIINKNDMKIALDIIKTHDFKLLGVYESLGDDMYEPIL